MKKILYCCFLLLCFPLIAQAQFPQYSGISDDDYANALLFLKQHKQDIIETFPDSVERSVAVSCLFPELLRYSMKHHQGELDELEDYEDLYVKQGASEADFSIGYFQMKPSFIEKLETHVSQDSVLVWYGGTFAYDSHRPHHQRKVRLQRMNDWHWQLRYYQCFFDLTISKIRQHPYSIEEQIQLSTISYNKSFELTVDEWEEAIDERYFPHGKKFEETQVSYAKVALDFYHQYYQTVF